MKLSLSLAALGLIVFCVSCSKSDSTPAPTYPIVGLYVGTYTDPNSIYPKYYSFDIRADSTILQTGLGDDGNTYYSDGTWSISGTAFTANLTAENLGQAGAKETVQAIYSSAKPGTLTGSVTVSGINTYSFVLERVP